MDTQPSTTAYSNGTSLPAPNSEPGPSRSSIHDPPDLKPSIIDSPDHEDSKKSRDPPKKKKASRACYHCQKAHLTCDDSRPCQRCIKRGCGDSCVEGQRKKAKYLLDEEELETLKTQKPRRPNLESNTFQTTPNESFAPTMLPHTDGLFTPPVDPNYSFGSEAANLEYAMISAMLSSNQVSPPPHAPPPLSNGWLQRSDSQSSGIPQGPFSATETAVSSPDSYRYPIHSAASLQQPAVGRSSQPLPVPRAMLPLEYQRRDSSGSYASSPLPLEQGQGHQNHLQQHPPPPPTPSTITDTFQSPISHGGSLSSGPQHQPLAPPRSFGGSGFIDGMDVDFANDVYTKVVAPYDYTAGYHYLMKHLQNGTYDKNDILRVVRALAIFRPSLIALQMPLSSEDEIFVEKCFQRSLLELEKLITMSGTPTVVWRRTGEICFVGLEFSLLTEWPRHELSSGKKYIYELFEPQSTVEYWENFANHAFENTTQSVHSHCVLVKPTGQHIPCTFCFSIRRDLFDLPYIVIGQWLPML